MHMSKRNHRKDQKEPESEDTNIKLSEGRSEADERGGSQTRALTSMERCL